MPNVSLVLLFVLLVAQVVGTQVPTFSTRRELVRVDVLVTGGGRPVTGLTRSDFEVRDNGVLQTIDLARLESIPLNVVLAFDLSSSVAGQRLAHLKQAGQAVLEALGPGDRVALVTFSHVPTLSQALTNDPLPIRSALERLAGRGDTALVDGLYASILVGESDGGRSLVIVFSDGMDTASWLPESSVLDTVRRSDVVVYSVTTGSRDGAFLRDVGKATGGGSLEVGSTAELAPTFVAIFDEFRYRYLLTYSPTGVDQDGWHELKVRVKRSGAAVTAARPGYFR
jgi:Ca-activated chloride channel homolog